MKNLKFYFYLFMAMTAGQSCSSQENAQVKVMDSVWSPAEEQLLDRVQQETFNYFWEAGEPISGGARERFHMDDVYPHHGKDIITSGGTGFGIMATLVGIHRGFITREQGYERLLKLTNWLEKSDRFHGAWPHWWSADGKVYPFSKFDDGGDLVETSFLVQGLIAARQFFKTGNEKEVALANQMDELWNGVDWNWYTQGQDVLYWHWSPNHDFKMNFAVRGHNECMIMYVIAASSPTHAIEADAFHKGYMRDGAIVTDRTYYGLPTIFDHYETNDMAVGPLFWAHYSHLGLDPRGLKSQYGDFWALNQNHAKIHYRHAVENPYDYRGYSDKCWGLTSSYSMNGYAGHNPQEDFGVISPTAALSSFPYTPKESMKFLKFLYEEQDTLVGEYGPYDAFSFQSPWYVPRYLAIDQLPIPVMIENARSGFIWDLFMSAPEIQSGLKKLGFTSNKDAIKVMTYNIRLDNEGDSADNWHQRKKDFVSFVDSENPDFFGIQEALAHQVAYIDSALSDYKYIGVGRDDGKDKGEFMALFYKENEWQLEKDSTIWLSETPATPSMGWDAACFRTSTYGVFSNEQGQKIALLNTHFDHQGEEARTKSVEVLKSFIESMSSKIPFLMMGDFNLEPTDRRYASITKFISDSRNLAKYKHEVIEGTFNGFKPTDQVERRIDYMFLNPNQWNVLTYTVKSPKTNKDRQLSDHFPVILEIEPTGK